MPTAIVLSGHLSLIRALARRGIDVVSAEYRPDQIGRLSRYAASHLRLPDPLRNEEAFTEALLAAGTTHEGSVVFPLWDEALVPCARFKADLSRFFVVAADDWETTRVFLEKARTSALADSLGIPQPLSMRVESVESARECAGRLRPPFLVKPDRTHEFQAVFGKKMVPIASMSDLDRVIQRCLEERLAVMVQEFIPGEPSDGAVYAGFFVDGQPLVETTHRKVRDGPPIYGSPRVVVSEAIPEIIDPGRRLLGAVDFTGFACVEFKRDGRDGTYKLMEVNARHNLAGALHIKSGVDYPWIHYEYLAHGRRPAPVEAMPGIYWVDVYRDVGYSLRNLRSERFTLRDYLRPYLQPHAYRMFDWRDPVPFLAFPWSKLRSRLIRPSG